MSISNLNTTYNNLTTDGLTSLEVDQIVDSSGQIIDTSNVVTYTNATKDVDLGTYGLNAYNISLNNQDLQTTLTSIQSNYFNLNSSSTQIINATTKFNQLSGTTGSYPSYFLGLNSNYELMIGNQAGPTGAQGIQGIQGPTGLIGPTGQQGVTGSTGAQGPTGLIGPTGQQGVIGATGAQGIQGPTGAQGQQGIIGSTGAQGAAGSAGSIGPTGPQGLQGPTGSGGDILGLNNIFSGINTFNNNLTTGMGYTTDLGDVSYSGVNPMTSGTFTTTGLSASAPASGTITYASPTYTLSFITYYMGCMWSSATFTPNVRTFFQFSNFNYNYYAGSSTCTVCQANTANTAYTALTSPLPLYAGKFINYFVPNSVSGYTGQIFFIFTNAKFGAIYWDSFTYSMGSFVVQGNSSIIGGTLCNRFYLTALGDNMDTAGTSDNAYGPWYGVGFSPLGYPCLAGYYGVQLQTGSGTFILTNGGNVGIGSTGAESIFQVSRSITANNDYSLMLNFQNSNPAYFDWAIGPYIASGSAMFAIRGGADGFSSLSNLVTLSASGDMSISGTFSASSSRTVNPTASAWVEHRWVTDSAAVGVIFKNGSTRSADGGVNTMTVRNDGGDIRLMNNGGGITISGSGASLVSNLGNVDINHYYGDISYNGWLYIRSALGLYWSNYGRGLVSPEQASNSYGTVSTWGTGRNGWAGYSIGSKCSWMSNGAGFGLHNNDDTWCFYNDGGPNRIQMFRTGNGGMTWYRNEKPSTNAGPGSWAETGCHVFCNSPNFSYSMPGVGIASFSNAYGGGLISLAPGVQWNWMIYAAAYHEFQTYGTTSTYVTNTGFYHSSDGRGKHSVKDLKTNRSLERILKTRTVQYKKLHDPDNELVPDDERDAVHIGFIAQEQRDVNPHCVKAFRQKRSKPVKKCKHPEHDPTETDDEKKQGNKPVNDDDGIELGEERYAVNYGDYVIHLVGAVQELHKRNEKQQEEIDQLKDYVKQQNEVLKQIIEKLK
jgi:hypothetical protein